MFTEDAIQIRAVRREVKIYAGKGISRFRNGPGKGTDWALRMPRVDTVGAWPPCDPTRGVRAWSHSAIAPPHTPTESQGQQ